MDSAPPPAPRASFEVDARGAVRDLAFGMVWLAALVVLLDVWLHLFAVVPSDDLRRLFDSTSERGLGSWVSVTQTALVALTLWGMAATYRRLGAAPRRWGAWAALAVFFSYLAFDDATRFHERVGTAFAESAASDGGLGAFPSYYWQVLFGPFFAAAGAFMAVFLWGELRAARLRLLVGGAFALLALAVALDFVDGLGPSHPWNGYAWLAKQGNLERWTALWFGMGAFDTVVHLSRSVEESVEMVAMTMLWSAFLLHAGATVGEVRLRGTRPEGVPVGAGAPRGVQRARSVAGRTGRRARAFSQPRRRPHAAPRPDA